MSWIVPRAATYSTRALTSLGAAVQQNLENAAASRIQNAWRSAQTRVMNRFRKRNGSGFPLSRRRVKRRKLSTVTRRRFRGGTRVNRGSTSIRGRIPNVVYAKQDSRASMVMNTPYLVDLLAEPSVLNRSKIARRQRGFIDVTSISLSGFVGSDPANDGPFVLHIAIFRPTDDDWTTGAGQFFTSPFSGEDSYETIVFGNAGLSNIDRNHLTIAKSAVVLHKHKKYVVQPYHVMTADSAPQTMTRGSGRYFKIFVPIKRRFHYSSDTDTIATERLYMLYWICPLRGLDTGLTGGIAWNQKVFMKAYP